LEIFTNIGQAHDENFINSDTKNRRETKSNLKRLKHLSITMITKKFMELLYVRGYLKILLLFVGGKDNTCDLEIIDILSKDSSSTIIANYDSLKVGNHYSIY